MEFLFVFALGIALSSGFTTWIFTYRHAEKKGFEAGYSQGHADAFQSMNEGKALVTRLKIQAEKRRIDQVLEAEIIGIIERGQKQGSHRR